MDLPKNYAPQEVEGKWYEQWQQQGYFRSVPDHRTPYTIVIPPPNVTGVLHMGHILNNTLQDVLIRRKRMEGYNACWVPGTDHASIATENKVVNKLREEGVSKNDISREEFLQYAWDWKEEHGGIILEQLKQLGCSCDWERTRFTMEEEMSQQVIKVFVDLYNKGKIYRGERIVHWDPQARTALSDEEVNYKEVQSKLYHVKYQTGTGEWLTIATTRPETILGDTAICVNPADDRYKHLHGKTAYVPLIGREVPIVRDEYVDMAFGTGALKVTPAHDANDHALGERHSLQVLNIMNEDGTFNQDARRYVGKDRFDAREAIVADLEEAGRLVEVEEITNNVGYSERTDAVVEPRLSQQWFLAMEQIARPALANVMDDTIRFHPAKFKNIYKQWMENIRDWCISRQLWWGQRIPAWYLPDPQTGAPGTDFVVAETEDEALRLAREKTGNDALTLNDLQQDEDVVDTWFSSWLWPISVFNGINEPDNEEVSYYYPTDTLVTAFDIIFFWVARMLMAGYEYRGQKPFSHVYFTGMVKDSQRRKMSKQLGNSPDPLRLINDYGADGVRMGMLFCAPAGNDLLFEEKLCEQGRNFCNKICNALRLVSSWQVDEASSRNNEPAIRWFRSKYRQTFKEINDHLEMFRFSEALKTLYSLIWDDFCSWYLEMVKPGKDEGLDQATYDTTIGFFEELMKVLHPFMPFVTEEVYQQLRQRNEGDYLIVAPFPKEEHIDEEWLNKGEKAKQIISAVRNARSQNNIGNKEALALYVHTNDISSYEDFRAIIAQQANLATFDATQDDMPEAASFIANNEQFYLDLGTAVDPEQERKRLLEEKEYYEGFIQSVQNKLQNEKFVQNAPEQVVEKERKKLQDGEQKLAMIEENLKKMG